ncbi:MAG: SagB/ThcOx family dehydrogenase [Thermoproteota archaeon]|nr:SagB/ThcOx family dehydrogenase [Thermoproteota archaeon]
MNKDISHTLEYHEKTKHSEISVMTSRHFLDWGDRPIPFKIYLDLPSISLPVDIPVPSINAISAIKFIPSPKSDGKKGIDKPENHGKSLANLEPVKGLTVMDISTLLFFSSGITRIMKYDFGNFYMRAASATGALYPIETYLVCNDILPGLQAGVYHFNPAEFSLTPIREGDYRYLLASIAGNNSDLLKSPLAIVFTSYAWRNAWKYQSRSYRHWFWDAGVIAANLLAIATSLNLESTLAMGFMDDELNRLLALENEKEASVSIAAIDVGKGGHSNGNKPENYPEHFGKTKHIPELAKIKTCPMSRKEIHYPEIWKAYNSSKLLDPFEVQHWIKAGLSETFEYVGSIDNADINKDIHEQQVSQSQLHDPLAGIGEVILKRGSTRRFSRSPISFEILSSIIYNSTRGIPLDFKKDTDTLIDVYLIANDVSGLEKGSYFFNRRQNVFNRLQGNGSRNVSGYLCLGQSLFSDASVVIFLMTDLNKVLKFLGNRGYRASQFEAGVIAGKIYLAAYSNGIGASGSTFYDDAVQEFFSPHAKDKETMIAIGIGVPSYKSKAGKVLPIKFSRAQLLQQYGHG